MRHGVSLVEVLLAAAILATAAGSIFFTLSSARGQLVRQDVALVGRLLASSVIEQAVHRLSVSDTRYFQLQTPIDEISQRAAQGRWKTAFLALAQPRTPVLSPPGAANPYFTGPAAPALPVPFDPDERRFYERFSYELRTTFDLVRQTGTAPVALDANGDGKPERDLAHLEVEVYFQPFEAGETLRSACKLNTLVVSQDKTPGAAALSEF